VLQHLLARHLWKWSSCFGFVEKKLFFNCFLERQNIAIIVIVQHISNWFPIFLLPSFGNQRIFFFWNVGLFQWAVKTFMVWGVEILQLIRWIKPFVRQKKIVVFHSKSFNKILIRKYRSNVVDYVEKFQSWRFNANICCYFSSSQIQVWSDTI